MRSPAKLQDDSECADTLITTAYFLKPLSRIQDGCTKNQYGHNRRIARADSL